MGSPNPAQLQGSTGHRYEASDIAGEFCWFYLSDTEGTGVYAHAT